MADQTLRSRLTCQHECTSLAERGVPVQTGKILSVFPAGHNKQHPRWNLLEPARTTCLALALCVTSAFSSFAQPPSAQVPDAQAMQQLQNMPFMDGMMELQEKYRKIEDQRKLERKAITDRIYEEELAKQKEKHAAMGESGFNYDPYAASEVAARQRLEPLHVQWAREDQELRSQMQEEMMNSTGMGDMLKQQREMTEKYSHPAPSGRQATPSR